MPPTAFPGVTSGMCPAGPVRPSALRSRVRPGRTPWCDGDAGRDDGRARTAPSPEQQRASGQGASAHGRCLWRASAGSARQVGSRVVGCGLGSAGCRRWSSRVFTGRCGRGRDRRSPRATAGGRGRDPRRSVTGDPAPAPCCGAWDHCRAAAWALADPAALARLYLPGSATGRRDVAMLMAYRDRGLRVVGMTRQVMRLRVVSTGPRRIGVVVTDRLVDARVVGAGVRSAVPDGRLATRLVRLARVDGRWRVAEVTARRRSPGEVTPDRRQLRPRPDRHHPALGPGRRPDGPAARAAWFRGGADRGCTAAGGGLPTARSR